MADYTPMAESRRPSVRVLASQAADVDLQPVFWGMEEEGIPVEVQEAPQGKAIPLAKEAAHMSPLNVGIGVNGAEGTLALHHRDLPADEPLFVVNLREASLKQLRRVENAARLVKGDPLALQDEVVSDIPIKDSRDVAETYSDELVERIVQSVLAEMAKA